MSTTDPAFSQLFKAVSADLGALASHTVALARLEFSTAISTVAWSTAGVIAGVLIALIGLLVFAGALVLIAVALGLPPWAAALVVAVVLIAAGGGTALYFVNGLRSAHLTLSETRNSLKETLEWLKQEAVS
jgi:phosphoglycerol transferase MdoB-like AlkP superfamily enzyme